MPSLGTLFLTAFGQGLLMLVILGSLLTICGLPRTLYQIAGCAVALVALPVWRMRANYRRIVTWPRAAWLGLGYGFGLFALIAGLQLGLGLGESIGSARTRFLADGGWFSLLILSPVPVFAIAWRVVRLTLPDFVAQNGTLCPKCAYCLIGVESMRCPECGSAFSYEDLETTEEAFIALADNP